MLGVRLEDIDALFLTHEHGDHCRGVTPFAARVDAEIWLTPGTWKALDSPSLPRMRLLSGHGGVIRIGALELHPYPVPHDAREPVQYVCRGGGASVAILTDAGCVTDHMRCMVSGCDALILEFNHDPALLRAGPYPPSVRRRVAGNLGHLANDQAADLLAVLGVAHIRHLVVGHMSATNNRRDLVLESLARVCRTLPARAVLAEQHHPSGWMCVPPSTD